MTMPVMEPDLDAPTLEEWARTIDDGPFSSLCWGERIAFDNPEAGTDPNARLVYSPLSARRAKETIAGFLIEVTELS